MLKPLPIVCTLTPSQLRDRGLAWRTLLDSGLVDRTRVAGGVRLAAEDERARTTLLALVELERSCCSWITIEIGEELAVTLTSGSADGEATLAQMFLPGDK
jgi:hypothetical protein